MRFPDWSSLLSFQAISPYALVPEQWFSGNQGLPEIFRELGPRLSPNASIHTPDSPAFTNATLRWQHWRSPQIRAAVAVHTEQDVQETILYANKHDIPFLAMVGGHGAIESLGNLHNGIEIWLRPMNKIEVSLDGTFATIQGGTKVKEAVDALWAKGKRTTTGVCECVGMLGSILGGGHGWLQGQYGLGVDQLLEARVVLANGTTVTASLDSHADLFWALRGAGHNFGVVTEIKYKIYDVDTSRLWAFETLIFTQDKLEQVYEAQNELRKTQPPEAILWGYITRVPDIDPVKPVLLVYIIFDGTPSALREFSAPLHDIDAVVAQAGEAPYGSGLADMTLCGENTLACQKGATVLRFPIYIKTWDTKALRTAYEIFSNALEAEPALNTSIIMLEGYSTQGVQAVAEETTAYPWRSDHMLVSPAIFYKPNDTLDATALAIGSAIRDAIFEGTDSSEMHTYVNYANGDESLEQIYGYEPWRLEKLRRLKNEYDPYGRFNFYAPIS